MFLESKQNSKNNNKINKMKQKQTHQNCKKKTKRKRIQEKAKNAAIDIEPHSFLHLGIPYKDYTGSHNICIKDLQGIKREEEKVYNQL